MKNKFFLIIIMLLNITMLSQRRDYKIHERGMLHQTVYNTGELGRGWETGDGGLVTSVPLMEWPPYSAKIIFGASYSGQQNSIGGGVHIAANKAGAVGFSNRLFSLCGAVGASVPENSYGLWSFPLTLDKVENYPILKDGSLNLSYDPNEAEEKIIASWATNTGIKVVRTSRAWSYPDYDDFIIYEYTFIYNGDTDGSGIVRDTTPLHDVQFCFVHGLGPSLYGYQRHYGVWKYSGGIYNGDQDMFFDPEYWLTFNMDRQTNLDKNMAGKPEPDSTQFFINARTGANGGGLCSPQAVGYCFLHYDTLHLAIVDGDASINESEFAKILGLNADANANYQVDPLTKHIKQPWAQRIQTGDISSTKQIPLELTATNRLGSLSASPSLPAKPIGTPYAESKGIAYKAYWAGRGNHQYSNTSMAVRKNNIFGPYTFHIGDTVRIALAEVVGYGAQAGKTIMGGRDSSGAGAKPTWNYSPTWNKPVYSYVPGTSKKVKVSNNYIDEFGYPDYVNSKVRNVMQVAHKAFEAYTGADSQTVALRLPIHPDTSQSHGKYNVPMPCPAPGVNIRNTDTGTVIITWNRNAEVFTSPLLKGVLASYKVYRSYSGEGPWNLLKVIQKDSSLNLDGNYQYDDDDQSVKIGDYIYYAVTSVDNKGNESGKTNLQKFYKNLKAVPKMDKVYVVPNPFKSKSGFSGGGEVQNKIGFFALPAVCTIRIYSFAGNLIQTIEHNNALYTEEWFQVTRNNQEIASGIYFYVVSTPNGDKFNGKFVVIK